MMPPARPARRLQVCLLLVAVIVSIFAGRLLQLQGVEASTYALQAMKSRSNTVTLYAERGDITDRSGTRLATTADTVAVNADPQLTAPEAERTADILSPLLSVPVLELEAKLRREDSRFVYLARKVDNDAWQQAREELADAGLPGIWADPDPLRTYPSGGVAGNLLGFAGTDGNGLAGLEQAYDAELRGEDGWTRYEHAFGRQIPLGNSVREDPIPGATLQLTLDRDVQWAAEQAITEQVENSGSVSGSVVVLDSHTGDLLAVASTPGFDPNRPTSAPAADRGHRALQEIYEPGSVAKLFTAAALLDAGYVDAETEITVPASLQRNGRRITDWWSHGTLQLTFAGAIAESSNIGTVLAAEQMPEREQADYLRAFGLGESTGLRFPGQSKGLLAPASEWSDLERGTISFGQGISVTAVQMASALGVIANGGVRMAPTLVAGTTDANGDLVGAERPEPIRVVGQDAAAEVGTMMEAVTAPDGLAPSAAIPGYRVAGKTGTAERVDPDCGCYRGYSASFGGFAPADTGRFVVYVVLHDPQGETSGSQVAAPVFNQVMSFVLGKYGVPPSGSDAPEVRLTW